MSKTADRISSRTVLKFGLVKSPVALYKAAGAEKPPTFTTAGPHGGQLERAPAKDGQRLPSGVPVAQEIKGTLVESPTDFERPDGPLDVVDHPLPEVKEDAPTEPVYVGVFEEGYDEEIDPDTDTRRGVRVGEDEKFVDLTDQLAKIDEQSKLEEMEVIAFVRREQVPRSRITGSYYLGGDAPDAPKVLMLLLSAMHRSERVAIVKWTKTKNQALGAIVPGRHSGALIVLELEWAENFKAPSPRCLTHLQATVTEEEVASATGLAMALSDSPAVIDEQTDDRMRLLRELIEKAEAGEVEAFEVPERAVVPDDLSLEELLKASVA